MTLLHAIFLGIVQGLTEFLPISSSGHLVLSQQILGLSEGMLTFDVFVHFGTLLSVVVIFRHSILKLIMGFIESVRALTIERLSINSIYQQSPELRVIIALAIGTVPAVIVGFTLKDPLEHLFSTPYPVLAALLFTGIVLLMTLRTSHRHEELTPIRGLLIGCAQALAIIPGISRSGMTISTALMTGADRNDAGEFSFLLSVPVIAGATLLTLKDALEVGLTSISWTIITVGTVASFLSGLGALVVLMRLVRRGAIGYFGYYCIAVAFAGMVYFHYIVPVTSETLSGEISMTIRETKILSSFDGTEQPLRYYEAVGKNRPLVVALHTWSFDYTQENASDYFTRCQERDWNCIFPNFRGPNRNPEAGGSPAALQDIADAVAWAESTLSIDHRRIFLVGTSGGGHMALLTASKSPSSWTAVSAWVPISDLVRWHAECTERELSYTGDVEAICGGKPGSSSAVDEEYAGRSPITSLWRAHIIPMDINAGIHDGHAGEQGGEGSVPVGQSIRAFNALALAGGDDSGIIPEDVIATIEDNESVPKRYRAQTQDPAYDRKIHLRATAGLTRLTIFEGGHELLPDAVFEWFDSF